MIDKKQYKIAFLILHYQNIDVTKKCINYLLRLNNIYNNYIVIIDNASPNGTGEIIKNMYCNKKNIHVICSKTNVGFSSGNNIGYIYAKNNLQVDVIVAMNSDVFINEVDFIKKMQNAISNNIEKYIIAPDIVVKNGYHQNPYMKEPISTEKQKKILIRKYMGYILYSIPFVGKKMISRKKIVEFQPNQKNKVKEPLLNIVPHGACVIYLPNWVNNENIAFIEGTFLFVEEELLYDYCKAKGYSILYYPNLVVNHVEDASQNLVNKNALEKKKNQLKYEIQSRKLLLRRRSNTFKEGL